MGKIVFWCKNGGEPRLFENEAVFFSTAQNWDAEYAGCKVFDVDKADATWVDASKWMKAYAEKRNTSQAEYDRKRIAQLELKTIDLENKIAALSGRMVGGTFALSGQ